MTSRPRSVTLVSWVFIVVGASGILKDVYPLLGAQSQSQLNALKMEGPGMLALIWSIRALAVVGGAFMLRGRNWARWLIVAWMAAHIVISMFHSALEVGMHVAVFGALGYVLFRPNATGFFTAAR